MFKLKRFLGANACGAMLLGLVLAATAQAAEIVTYLHNDAFGSPVLATGANGAVLWRESYRPYGERLKNEPPSVANRQWFAGKPQDTETGLSYFGARYYDPVIGRFMGIDPQGFQEQNIQSFNRYTYGNNNPYKFIDLDGRQATSISGRILGSLVLGAGAVHSFRDPKGIEATQNALRRLLGIAIQSEGVEQGTTSGEKPTDAGSDPRNGENTNPYAGPVDRPVVVVDPRGNAIPVDSGQQITGSPNGDYTQVRNREGNETGLRLDRGGHKNRRDPRARDPHAHVPGVTLPDGNEHLPIK